MPRRELGTGGTVLVESTDWSSVGGRFRFWGALFCGDAAFLRGDPGRVFLSGSGDPSPGMSSATARTWNSPPRPIIPPASVIRRKRLSTLHSPL